MSEESRKMAKLAVEALEDTAQEAPRKAPARRTKKEETT